MFVFFDKYVTQKFRELYAVSTCQILNANLKVFKYSTVHSLFFLYNIPQSMIYHHSVVNISTFLL